MFGNTLAYLQVCRSLPPVYYGALGCVCLMIYCFICSYHLPEEFVFSWFLANAPNHLGRHLENGKGKEPESLIRFSPPSHATLAATNSLFSQNLGHFTIPNVLLGFPRVGGFVLVGVFCLVGFFAFFGGFGVCFCFFKSIDSISVRASLPFCPARKLQSKVHQLKS